MPESFPEAAPVLASLQQGPASFRAAAADYEAVAAASAGSRTGLFPTGLAGWLYDAAFRASRGHAEDELRLAAIETGALLVAELRARHGSPAAVLLVLAAALFAVCAGQVRRPGEGRADA